MSNISLSSIGLYSKETLVFSEPKRLLELNKKLIFILLDKFRRKNPNIGEFYVGGSASLMLQGYIARKVLSDVDVYCGGQNTHEVLQIDIIKEDIFPPGWKDRVVEICRMDTAGKPPQADGCKNHYR